MLRTANINVEGSLQRPSGSRYDTELASCKFLLTFFNVFSCSSLVKHFLVFDQGHG